MQTESSHRARRAKARPDAILDAALIEFASRGFDAARMEDVARRAGLSKPGIYLYFASKEALLEALIAREVAPLAAQVEKSAEIGAAAPLDTLRAIGRFMAMRLSDADLMRTPRLVVSISNRFPTIARLYRESVVDVALGAAERLIGRAMEQGEMRQASPRAVARAFIGPIILQALWTHALGGEAADPETFAAEHFDLFVKGAGA